MPGLSNELIPVAHALSSTPVLLCDKYQYSPTDKHYFPEYRVIYMSHSVSITTHKYREKNIMSYMNSCTD